jgi:hypothetical protein
LAISHKAGLVVSNYATSTNRITPIGSSGTSYNSDGNVTNESIHSFAWDAYGTPATIDGVGTTYDELGRMVERNNGRSITQVIHTPGGASAKRLPPDYRT